MITLPPESRTTLLDRFGPTAAAWCDDFPALVAAVTAEWGLVVGGMMPVGGTSVVLRTHDQYGVDTVLKLTPEIELAREEATALGRWAGSPRSVQLVRVDLGRSALLLERLRPGRPVKTWALPEIAELMDALWQPGPAPLPPLADRVRFLFELYRRRAAVIEFPTEPLLRGEDLALELAASGGRIGLVHGDLHAGNVLTTDRGLVAIDPRPVIGDVAVDAVDWALDGATSRADLQRNAAIIAEHADVDADRIVAWSEAFAPIVAISCRRRGERERAAQLLDL